MCAFTCFTQDISETHLLSPLQSIVRDFKVSMALDEISRLENIQVPAYQVEEQVQSLKDQAVKTGEMDEFDDESVRKKVESTLERRMVFDFLAEHANLEVEYMKEGEGEFDEAMLEKLAQESLEREQASSGEGEQESDAADEVFVAAAESPIKSEAAAETVNDQEEETEHKKSATFKYDDVEFDSMDRGEKAFKILVDLGMVELYPDPDSPDFDASAYTDDDDE